jgi:DNA-binding NarL/FixJ family response regulator
MPALARGDEGRLLRFVAEAESFGGDHPFAGEFLMQLGQLLPADWVGVTECDERDGFCHNLERPGDDELFSDIDWAAVMPVLEAEHPVFLRFREGTFAAVKLSDFLTGRELRRTQMFRLVLRPLGLEDSLGIQFRVGPKQMIKLVLDRSGCSFSGGDRVVLDSLRPHLQRLYRADRVRKTLRQALALHESTDAPVVLLEGDERVAFASTAGRELLDRYFGESGVRLPDSLASWLRERRRAGTSEPLRIDAGDRALVVELVDGALLFEERQWMPRLTAREREILDLVAEGRTNAEIAERLCVSFGTVKKHLDNIYAKLGVHTRTAAAAFVRERRRSPQNH